MIFNQRNHLSSFVIVFVLMISFVFCCGAAWNTVLPGDGDMTSDHSACGMGDVGSQSSSDHNQFIFSSVSSLLNNFNIILLVVLVSVFLLFFLKFDTLWFYFKRIRERYGGFRLFDNFVNLFRLGIINPKTF
jgi:hypothetical protein